MSIGTKHLVHSSAGVHMIQDRFFVFLYLCRLKGSFNRFGSTAQTTNKHEDDDDDDDEHEHTAHGTRHTSTYWWYGVIYLVPGRRSDELFLVVVLQAIGTAELLPQQQQCLTVSTCALLLDIVSKVGIIVRQRYDDIVPKKLR